MIGVILAGGSGTRFWPLSRASRPKQFLNLFGDEPMIAQAANRLTGCVKPEDIFVVCGETHLSQTRSALTMLDASNFLVEPRARNTAPAIALAAVHARHRYGDMPMAVFPSDHYIRDEEGFRDCLRRAQAAAQDDYIVTLGIEPTRPETGYGYIRYDAHDRVGDGVFRVEAFVEKPDLETAQGYLRAGNFAWNAGIFVFKPSTLLTELKRQRPALYEGVERIAHAVGSEAEADVTREVFESLESISIDYAVMEGAEKMAVVPADIGWSDVGHWAAIPEVCPTDAEHNVFRGNVIARDVENSVVHSESSQRVVALVGVRDLVVVDTPDALLVVPRERAQEVREIVAQLAASGSTESI